MRCGEPGSAESFGLDANAFVAPSAVRYCVGNPNQMPGFGPQVCRPRERRKTAARGELGA